MHRNHEHYKDPTAREAIRKTSRLTYRIGEMMAVKHIVI